MDTLDSNHAHSRCTTHLAFFYVYFYINSIFVHLYGEEFLDRNLRKYIRTHSHSLYTSRVLDTNPYSRMSNYVRFLIQFK